MHCVYRSVYIYMYLYIPIYAYIYTYSYIFVFVKLFYQICTYLSTNIFELPKWLYKFGGIISFRGIVNPMPAAMFP